MDRIDRQLQTTNGGGTLAIGHSESRTTKILQHLSQMSSDGIELGLVLPSPEAPPLSPEIFAAGVAKMGMAFNVDYIGKDGAAPTGDSGRIRILWDMLCRRGWTDADFEVALDQFLERTKFANWALADFFGGETDAGNARPRVYPYSWYVKQVGIDRSNDTAIGGYRVEGYDKPVWGWRHEIRDALPEWVVQSVTVAPASLALLPISGGKGADMQTLAAAEARIEVLEGAIAAVLVALVDDRMAARAGAPPADAEAWTPEINRLRAILDPEGVLPPHPATDMGEGVKNDWERSAVANRGCL